MRADGRRTDEIRSMTARVGELDRADGSGRFGFGPIAALASFTGPIEVRLREEQVSSSTLEVVHRPLEGVGGVSSRALESVLDQVFKSVLNLASVPRSLCQIVVQSLSAVSSTTPETTASGSGRWPPSEFPEPSSSLQPGLVAQRTAAINAATLAALHAGSIGLRAVPLAVALVKSDGEWLVDPSCEEEQEASARFAFAWAFGTGMSGAKRDMVDEGEIEGEIVWTCAEGSFSRDEFEEATRISKAAAEQVYDFVKEELGAYYEQRQK